MTAPSEIAVRSNAELQRLVVQGATSDQANRYEGGNLAETNGQRSAERGRGKVVPKVCVDAQIFQAEVPTGAGFKGYEDFLL